MIEERNNDILAGDDIKAILSACYKDIRVFGKVLFPNMVYLPFYEPHNSIAEVVNNDENRKIVIASGRGVGKTTIAKLLAQKSILFGDYHFICYIGKSSTYAEMQTENIKSELRSNSIIRKLFGDIKTSDYGSADDTFSKKTWIAYPGDPYKECIILPRGRGQQIRGLNWKNYRPDLFIIDDLEDDKALMNDSLRMEDREWFDAQVLLAKPIGSSKYKYFYIDTVKHPDALIEHLLNDPDWLGLRLAACDDDYKTLTPDFWPQEELDKELEKHRRNHTMDIFARERQCKPVSTEAAQFKASLFQYYSETDKEFQERLQGGFIENAVIGDPAKTANMSNAESGIAVWGIDVELGKMYLREAIGEHYYPNEFYDAILDRAMRYNASVVGIEVTGLEEYIKHPFSNEMMSRNLFFPVEWLKARRGVGDFSGVHGGKLARIGSLAHYYRKGLIYHNRVGCGKYEGQILAYPKSVLWDVADAAAYIVELMELGERYFYSSTNKNNEGEYDIESEYQMLDDMYEPAIEGFRIV